MEKLNDDVISKILSGIPIEFVSRCKLVCRSWERLLSRSRNGGLLFAIGQRTAKLYYADYYDLMSIDNPHRDEPYYCVETRAIEIDHPPIDYYTEEGPSSCVAIGSHNGLVCFSVPNNGLRDPVYICNPITGEYVDLPRFDRRKGGYIVSGFAYLPSRNEYKVLRICYPDEKLDYPQCSTSGWVQVYTIGNNNNNSGWRDIGEITNTLWLSVVQANGALHFMDDVDWKIVAFDLEAEEFGMLPPPPCFEKSTNSRYRVHALGGDLYVVHEQMGEHVSVWSFRHHENKKHYGRSREEGYESWSWSKIFSFEWEYMSGAGYFKPFSMTERNEFLFWVGNWNLCCYDHETGNFKKIVDMNEDRRLSFFQGIPYKSSLVSLKDLGVPSKVLPRQETLAG